MNTLRILAIALLAASASVQGAVQPAGRAAEGILLLAHGGQPEWNARVTALAASLDGPQPVEVAFGMASRPAIQGAVDKLVSRGATRIVAVPLFVSSHSSVVTSTEYLLGLRREMPPDLKIFAKMNHGAHGAPAAHGAHAPADHAAHGAAAAPADNTTPVASPVPVRMTAALNQHPLVAAILTDRANAMSRLPEQEAVVIVAHGPVPDEDNKRWLADMRVLADRVKSSTRFAGVDYLTVRDDAPKPTKDAATAELRSIVETHHNAGRRVLIVPLLLSYGGIEKGIRQRLEGLEYVMAAQALVPDERIAQWVRESVAASPR